MNLSMVLSSINGLKLTVFLLEGSFWSLVFCPHVLPDGFKLIYKWRMFLQNGRLSCQFLAFLPCLILWLDIVLAFYGLAVSWTQGSSKRSKTTQCLPPPLWPRESGLALSEIPPSVNARYGFWICSSAFGTGICLSSSITSPLSNRATALAVYSARESDIPNHSEW